MRRIFRFIVRVVQSYVPLSESFGGFLQHRVRLPEFVAFPVAFLVMLAGYVFAALIILWVVLFSIFVAVNGGR
jgi:hypothetical protein